MAIDIYVAKSLDEVRMGNAEHVSYEDEIASALNHLAVSEGLDASLLWNLDPYADVVIPVGQVQGLYALCDACRFALGTSSRHQRLWEFLTRLQQLCQMAIAQGKPLLAVGD